MNMKRLLLFGAIIVAVMAGVTFIAKKPVKVQNGAVQKPIVSVSTFTLYEAAKAVGGETLDIRPIIPFGSDAHMFSPNPVQVAQISSSLFFIYNGAGFETWAQSLINTLPNTTTVIDMSRHVALIKGGEHDGHQSEHEAYDPHYWLNIDNMIRMTQTIDAEFSKRFPKNAEMYHKNTALYLQTLEKLKADYQTGLRECKNRTLVSNHDAFGYLAHANGLKNISVIGLSSDEQPSANTIAHIVILIKELGIKTIFFEELINDNIAQTIAKETGAKSQPLQPLENISENELKSHQTYESIMRTNLAKLTEAMECH